MGRVAVAHGIDLVDTFLVNIVLKSASWLLRFASLLEGVTARISISQTGGISVVHPVVGRADHGQESFGTLRVDKLPPKRTPLSFPAVSLEPYEDSMSPTRMRWAYLWASLWSCWLSSLRWP